MVYDHENDNVFAAWEDDDECCCEEHRYYWRFLCVCVCFTFVAGVFIGWTVWA